MNRSWHNLKYVQAVLRNKMNDNRLPKYVRDWYERLYTRLLWHEDNVNDAILEAIQQGVRNPAFPGDMVGWLADDFDDYAIDKMENSKSLEELQSEHKQNRDEAMKKAEEEDEDNTESDS